MADSVCVLGVRLGVADRGEEIARVCAGHWLPEMIGLAGGVDVLGRSGEPSYATTWKTVFALEPELVVVGPCGFGADDAAARGSEIDWPVSAIAVDGDGYYSRPGPRLADGVVQARAPVHPDAVPDPALPAIPLVDAVINSVRSPS